MINNIRCLLILVKSRQQCRKGVDLIIAILFLTLTSCASLPPKAPDKALSLAYFVSEKEDLPQRFAPVFIVENPEKDYNRIGTPVATEKDGEERVYIDADRATYYTSIGHFTTAKDNYTNLIYRIHFKEIPFSIVPFNLGAGENIGLLTVVTLNSRNDPVLYTLLHTCGCYLAFVPTSNLPDDSLPEGWHKGRQDVYGENLPGYLSFSPNGKDVLLMVHMREEKHRVKNVWLASIDTLKDMNAARPALEPFPSLEKLALPDGGHTSFYETSGSRKDYVKGSQKIWERLLISWWALDWRVGEDKKLGSDTEDGIVFYTSLKPWAREESDLRDFPRFLNYWGWRL